MNINDVLILKGYKPKEVRIVGSLLSQAENAPTAMALPHRNDLAGRRLLAHAKRFIEQERMREEYMRYR